jgi:KamA family protein
MIRNPTIAPRRYRSLQRRDLADLPQLAALDADYRRAMLAVSAVLPFRTNGYVAEDLIDWSRVPDDPIFQLTFPQPGMLAGEEFADDLAAIRRDRGPDAVRSAVGRIRARLNPHPAGQRELNVPLLDGEPLPGMQHKYRETVLFFPSQGQTCHAYCTYCFRWAQFVGDADLKFASGEAGRLVDYVRRHREITNVLFTGGDPLTMKARVLRRYVEPLLAADLEHLESIRIGSKAPAYWPYRFVTDDDADDLLALFAEVRAAGKHLALMAHYSHPRELSTPVAQEALRRIQDAGAVVRCQAPLIRHVNDDAAVWADLWRAQVRHGAVPYYMFVERDTGPRDYFAVPLARGFRIYRDALRRVSGLARTVRGPSMSATPGKVVVDGTAHLGGEKVFCLRFLQGRDPDWVGRPFFARFDPEATWLDELEPAAGQPEFFFAEAMSELAQASA